jgi:transcriptional regulator with XRE-family HTH domain
MEAIISIMPTDNDIRKDFGQRIKQLRKQRNWTQKVLATKIDVRFPQLNKYESGLHTPPI